MFKMHNVQIVKLALVIPFIGANGTIRKTPSDADHVWKKNPKLKINTIPIRTTVYF